MAIYLFSLLGFSLMVIVLLLLALHFRRSMLHYRSRAETLSKRLSRQELISAIYQSFISSEDMEILIHNALMMLVMSMKVSRAVLVCIERAANEIHFHYEWTDPMLNLRPIDKSGIQHISETVFYNAFIIKGDAHLACDDITDVPELAGVFGNYCFKSFIFVPVSINEGFWGALGVTLCDTIRSWEESDIKLLKLASGAISTLLIRAETEKELAEARAQSEQSNKAKSYFLSHMSHEMRTPMNTIIGMTTIALNSHEQARIRNCLEKINEASLHLLGVINDILDMSKIEYGKFKISCLEFDFEKMLKRVIDIMEFRLIEKKQHFTLRLDQEVPAYIMGDEQRIAQVLTNLLSNAVKFTIAEGTIILAIKVMSVNGNLYTLRFDVIDSGIGISPEQKGRLFRLFEQADDSISRKFGGSGIGLVVSKSIVDLMGGRIWVDSVLGKGSDFAFEISVEKGKTLPDAAHNQQLSRNNFNIMVIDNSWEVLNFFREYSERMGISCITAFKTDDALRIMDSMGCESPDFIFAVWNSQAVNNAEQISRIKSRFRGKALVVMTSDSLWERIEIDAKNAGADAFISKPLFSSALTEIINNFYGDIKVPAMAGNNISGIFRGYTIILADDVEINQEIIISFLEETGVSIESAENGAEVVRKFREDPYKYSAILMDIHMPEMDGYQATGMIRSIEARMNTPELRRNIPIIAMTANVFAEDVKKCFAAGMNAHLGKPIDAGLLIGELQKALYPKIPV